MILVPNKTNTYPELAQLASDKIEIFNRYHGEYATTDKKNIIYSCLGEKLADDEVVKLLETFNDCRVAVVTTRDYPTWIEQKYNCKFFKIPTAYAYYTKEMFRSDINFDRTFDKLILSLNNRAQWNRQALYQFILNFNLQEHFYFSYLLEDRFHVGDRRKLYDEQNAIIGPIWYNANLDLEAAYQQLPYRIDDFVHNDWGPGSIQFYETSFCSFVNETYIDENYNVFFTEKTMKPLAYGHPMLLFSSAGALQELKNLGFETYSSIFDESYDTIESPQIRFEYLLKLVLELCKLSSDEIKIMYSKIKPVLQHNYNQFWNVWHNQYLKDIEQVKLQINEFLS